MSLSPVDGSLADHMFYHKWAVLINPKESGDGAKGYIKCDISVLGKGDVARVSAGQGVTSRG